MRITHFKKILIGKDSDENYRYYHENWNGNNILVKLSDNRYLFFGCKSKY